MSTVHGIRGAGPARLVALSVPLIAACCGLLALHLAAPEYLFHQGFPLDDSWIHAVYARELARSGMLAYNPGIPSTGETAPLWAAVLALPHLLASSTEAAVALTKATGFALHAVSAVLVVLALRRFCDPGDPTASVAGAFVAFHPDLLAASVSGMEVPLAAAVLAATTFAIGGEKLPAVGLLGAVSAGARPETVVFAICCGALFWIPVNRRKAFQYFLWALAGGVFALGALAARNWWVSGLPLPATFYAKANVASPFHPAWQRQGFEFLMGRFPLTNSTVILTVGALVSVALLWHGRTPIQRLVGSMYLSGLALCSVSFALVPPFDPAAFYHQRYVLPALLPIVAALPHLSREVLKGLRRRAFVLGQVAVVAFMAALLVRATPARAARLSNDARNIDDVQVALGRALGAEPATRVLWVVDAGAPRFFGRPFVVDLVGLNTPELLDSSAQEYLHRYPPHYLDIFAGWSRIRKEDQARLPARTFQASTAYTVTSQPVMGRHVLVFCQPAGYRGRLAIFRRSFKFQCAR